MGILDRAHRKSHKIENQYPHKAILFIPSESYDAATIAVLQGLDVLGFKIYTYRKGNINSWWCNTVLDKVPPYLRFDFVLSNLHWGTQWHLYNELGLNKFPRVLIDGCDNRDHHTWLDKYHFYCERYKKKQHPSGTRLHQPDPQPWRWMEPLDGYKPDVVFTSQKLPEDTETIYLPFGIQSQYRRMDEGWAGNERTVDFTNIPGPQERRAALTEFLKENERKLLGIVHNAHAGGEPWYPKGLEATVRADNNVHSYFRWIMRRGYFRLLSRTKVFLYPGVWGEPRPQWDSKRPWEAYACGCLVMTEKPPINMDEYPMTELCPWAVWTSHDEMVDKCQHIYRNQGWAEQLRIRAVEGALRYFTPVSIARYFLWRLKKRL